MDHRPTAQARKLAAVAPVVALVIAVAGQSNCSSHDEAAPPLPPVIAEGVQTELPVVPPSSSTATTTPPSPSTSTTASTATTTSPTRLPVVPPGFESSVTEIDAGTAARLTASWRPGCPVPLRDLRLLTITHWGFDGQPRPGELVVHAAHAEGVRRVFAELFAAAFPIEQVRLVDEFGGDDDRSMAANNTSAFNCRSVRGSRRWSQHASGLALDINPLQNPYVTRGGTVLPPGGHEYLRREGSRQGVITARGPVMAAFARIGWRWGGRWSTPDYQHFSASGR